MDNLLNATVTSVLDFIPASCFDPDGHQNCDHGYHQDNGTSLPNDHNYRRATYYCALLMLCFCVVGLIGNVISILVFTRRSMRCSPINALLTVLSAVDCWVLLVAIAIFVIPGLNTYFHFVDSRILYKSIVTGFYQMGMVAQTCSVYTFVLISFERYIAVVHPLQVQRLLTVNRALMAEVIVVVSAFLYNIPRFFEYRSDEVYGYAAALRRNTHYFAIYYTTLYLMTHFLAPFLTIAILNGFIFRTISRAKRERRSLLGESQNSKVHSSNCNRTTRMVVIVTLIFGTCNVLPFSLNIWEALEPDVFEGKRKAAAYLSLDVSNVLVAFNSSSTFVIYYLHCQRYRTLLKEWLPTCFLYPTASESGAPPTYATDVSRVSVNQLNQKSKVALAKSCRTGSKAEMYDHGSSMPLMRGQRCNTLS